MIKPRWTLCCLTTTDEKLKEKVEAVIATGKYKHLEIYEKGLEIIIKESKISIDK